MSSPISGFTAIPNPQMLAFMPIQSYLMMYFAGSGWQYGKRKISAMTNEQFNKLTPEELLKQHSIELKNMLPTLDKTLDDVTPLIKTLVEQYGDFVREAIKAIPDAIGNIFQGTAGNVQNSQFGVTQVRYTRSQEGERESTKEYWEQVARDAWKQASSIPSPKQKIYPKYNPPVLTREQQVSAFGSTTIIPQLSITEQQRQTKRKAGQSQILERKLLITQIKGYSLKIKEMQDARGFSAKSTNYRIAVAQFQAIQQRLVNLLSRYQF